MDVDSLVDLKNIVLDFLLSWSSNSTNVSDMHGHDAVMEASQQRCVKNPL